MKRLFFWLGFIVVLALIIWGLIAAMNKSSTVSLVEPAPVGPTDHVRGPADARVTLIEYSDFQCPACEAYYPVVSRIFDESSTTVRLVYRHFPLSQHKNAVPAAIASEAAAAQGKFWEMYDELFSNHADWTELADPTAVFMGYATKIGLDTVRFKADLSSSTIRDFINSQQDEGIHIGIDHTPTFFINGKVIDNPQGYEPFKALIDAAASSSPR